MNRIDQTARRLQRAGEKAAEAAFYRHCRNVQFDVMDLGKISAAGAAAYVAAQDVDAAVIAARELYRKN